MVVVRSRWTGDCSVDDGDPAAWKQAYLKAVACDGRHLRRLALWNAVLRYWTEVLIRSVHMRFAL